MSFNPDRLLTAMKRRRVNGKMLAELTGLSSVTISRLSNEYNVPEYDTLKAISKALKFPIDFFSDERLEILETEAVSFRSLSKMRAAEREAAVAAGTIGLLFSDWIDNNFNLPVPDLPDLREHYESPHQAAKILRQHWKLGESPIKHMLKLLEAKGVRIFSLTENTSNVDAYSFWRDDRPFIFLNNFKTPEHSRFDAAHELGHLVLHKHGLTAKSKDAEREANEFASSFLMPERDIHANAPRKINTESIVRAKARWRVSAMAMVHRLYTLDRVTDWQYRSICIDLTKRGYRKSEPIGIERESSVVWDKVFKQLWADKITKKNVASELCIPLNELESLVFGLTCVAGEQIKPTNSFNQGLKLV